MNDPKQVNLNAENVCLMEIELADTQQMVSLLTSEAYKEHIKKVKIENVGKSPIEENPNLVAGKENLKEDTIKIPILQVVEKRA